MSATLLSPLDALLHEVTAGRPPAFEAALRRAALPLLGHDQDEATLEETVLQVALAESRDDPDHGVIARDLLLRRVYRSALGTPTPSEAQHREGFAAYLARGVAAGVLDPRLRPFAEAARFIQPARDRLLPYLGLATMADRYLVKDPEGALIEPPCSILFLRVALAEEQPLAWAERFYERMSSLRYLPGTPTLFNAGTPQHQLSSCYVSDVHDLQHILETAHDFGLLAKYAGGVGTSVTKLRAMGSPVRGVNGKSSGLTPFVTMFDALFKAIDQGGRRRGTLAV